MNYFEEWIKFPGATDYKYPVVAADVETLYRDYCRIPTLTGCSGDVEHTLRAVLHEYGRREAETIDEALDLYALLLAAVQ